MTVSGEDAKETRRLKGCDILRESRIDEPFVSIIMPVYNTPIHYLEECLQSVVPQLSAKIELIVVDDASTTNVLEPLLDFASRNKEIAVLHMSSNSRQGAARNRGLDYAHGRYIGYMDPDDVVSPRFFTALAQEAERSQADLVAAPYMLVDDGLKSIGGEVAPFSDLRGSCASSEWQRSLMHTEFAITACLYKKSLLELDECRFPEGVLFEDNPAKMVWKSKIRSIETVDGELYYWRQHSDSTIHSIAADRRVYFDRLATSDMLIDDAKRLGYYDKYKEEIEFAYAKLYLYNTLTSIAESGDFALMDDVSELSSHARAKLQGFFVSNRYIAELPIKSKIGWAMALRFPALFVKASSFLLAKG